MNYVTGDILKAKTKTIAVCAPRDLKTIYGIVDEILNKYGGRSKLRKQNKKVGECYFQVYTNVHNVIYLITREHSTSRPSYEYMYKAIDELLKYCKENNIKENAIPKYRCGIDKLDWSEILTLLNNKLINNGIKCDVYVQEPEQYIEKSVYELSMNELIAKDNDDEIKQLKERIKVEKSKDYSGFLGA